MPLLRFHKPGSPGHFSGTASVDPACEGQQVLGFLGHLFAERPRGVRSHPVYRCNAGADHFDSVTATCEGKTTEFRIGHLIG